MNKDDIRNLFERYLAGTATDEEESLLESWYLEWSNNKSVDLSDDDMKMYLSAMREKNPYLTGLTDKRSQIKVQNIAAVFIILITAGAIVYYSTRSFKPIDKQRIRNHIASVVPGGSRAILTLGNGQQISLTDADTGTIASENGHTINKTGNGEIVYQSSNSIPPKGVTYNTVSTPRGGLYAVILPDGTKVVLNAATSLRYPTVFLGKERKVELSGEAYFIVVHNSSQPFSVQTKSQLIEDVGTEFNTSSYDDDDETKTTLIQGCVKVTDKHTRSMMLTPGQQSLTDKSGLLSLIKHPDIEEVTAWKNGFFKFDGETIDKVMMQISRWYAVRIIYEKDITKEGFYGTVSRTERIEDVLKMLELTGLVHFKLSENAIIVQH